MSLVGIFSQSLPEISGVYFDAVLEEKTVLQTDVTEFPIEDGSFGNDHALRKPLHITMTVGTSDNPVRALREIASRSDPALGSLVGIGASVGVGRAVSALSGPLAAAAGLAANAAYAFGQSSTRSGTVLEAIRAIQRSGALIKVISSKGKSYDNCIITSTSQTTSKENEQGLVLTVEMRQMLIINAKGKAGGVPASNDTATTQAQREVDFGEVVVA